VPADDCTPFFAHPQWPWMRDAWCVRLSCRCACTAKHSLPVHHTAAALVMQHSPSPFLQESFLIAERQKAVMFATLNRARQTLEDQGAQVCQCFSRRGGIPVRCEHAQCGPELLYPACFVKAARSLLVYLCVPLHAHILCCSAATACGRPRLSCQKQHSVSPFPLDATQSS